MFNFVIRSLLAVFAIIPLIQVQLLGGGPAGAKFATLTREKMKREIFSSLQAPLMYYFLFIVNVVAVFFTHNDILRAVLIINVFTVWIFLYRLGPNIVAWASIMKVVRITPGSGNDLNLVKRNVAAELRRQAEEYRSEYEAHNQCDHIEGVSIPKFNHSEWLARQLEFWSGERKSLFYPQLEK